jgi:hypothetical protein
MQQRSFLTLVALATCLVLACGGDARTPVDPASRVGSVVLVGPDSVVDDSLGVYTLVIRDREGQLMPVPSGIAWTFDNPENQAQLHELAPGQLELRAWNPGPVVRIAATVYGVEVSIVVRLVPHPPIIAAPPLPLGRVTYYPQSYLAPNDTTRFSVRLGETLRIAYVVHGLDDRPIDYNTYGPWLQRVRWESSDTSVATVVGVDQFQVTVAGKAMGNVTIRPVLDAAPRPLTLRVTEPLPPVGALPDLVAGGHRWRAVNGGLDHSCGLTTDGDAYCWGATALGGPMPKGETCTAPGGAYNTPSYQYDCRRTPLLLPGDHRFQSLSAYSGNVCGASADGAVWCWAGAGAPTVVPGLSGARAVSVGPRHGCAVLSDDGVRCWGDNNSLALGASGLAGAMSFVTPAAPAGAAATLGAGIGHTCEVRRDGVAVCWGAQRAGQLGRGGFVR